MWQDIKNIYHLFLAILANFWYGFPSKKLVVIGVTGTDGKTTTVNLIYHILKDSGKDVSMICTNGAVINGKTFDVGDHVTTPSSFMTQRFMKEASEELVHEKVPYGQYLVLEVTSHALDQYRDWGINFEVGVLTNVTHEHLDYHKTYDSYLETKIKLLKKAKTAVVNADDESYKRINSKVKTQKSKFITYGIKNEADINLSRFPFKTKLIGEFNRYNILAAIGACQVLGIDKNIVLKSIESFKPPLGRGNIVYDNSFKVMVDFAHTPNGIEQILKAVKPQVKGRIIHVFGSAGDRDKYKRPLMGKISSNYSDIIILTAEDPRKEPLINIIDEIASGVREIELKTNKKVLMKILDRQQAINKAVKLAQKGDLVLITGKGHEKSMNSGKGEVSWSEYKAIEEALEEKNV